MSTRLVCCFLTALALGCAASRETAGRSKVDGGRSSAEELATAVAEPTDAATAPCGTAQLDASSLEAVEPFWKAFEVRADWAEYFPTLRELVDNSDTTALGMIASINVDSEVHSEAEDLVGTAIVKVQISSFIGGKEAMRDSLELSLLYNRPWKTTQELNKGNHALSCHLPKEPVLLMLRRRADREDQYRVVNGAGLWARTRRSTLDTPLDPEPPSEPFFAAEIAGISSVAELAAVLAN